jgi:hypothetical protein
MNNNQPGQTAGTVPDKEKIEKFLKFIKNTAFL